jgi:hypothetical protein
VNGCIPSWVLASRQPPSLPFAGRQKNLPEKRRKPAENLLIRHRRERFRWNWVAAGRAQLHALQRLRTQSTTGNPLLRSAPVALACTRVATQGPRRTHALATVSAEIARHPGILAHRLNRPPPAVTHKRSPPRAARDRGLFPPRPVLAPKRGAGGPSPGCEYDAPKMGSPLSGFPFARASALIRATVILLTQGVDRTGPGWACRAKRGAASRMSPNPGAASSPASAAELRHRMRCGRCGRSRCGRAIQKPHEINVLAVLRFQGRAGDTRTRARRDCIASAGPKPRGHHLRSHRAAIASRRRRGSPALAHSPDRNDGLPPRSASAQLTRHWSRDKARRPRARRQIRHRSL